jgi:hypothetical protein
MVAPPGELRIENFGTAASGEVDERHEEWRKTCACFATSSPSVWRRVEFTQERRILKVTPKAL